MNWDRVERARRRGRALLAIAGFAIVLLVPLYLAAPRAIEPMFGGESPSFAGIPTSILLPTIGIGGVFFGLAWMWRLYTAPTKDEGAHWRFRDHG